MTSRNIGLAAPVVCALLAFAGLFLQNRRMDQVSAELTTVQGEAAKAAEKRKAAEAAQSDLRYAASDSSSAEDLRFMDNLRKQAQARGLEITSIGASLIGKLERPDQSPADMKMLDGVQEVATTVTLVGPYLGLRGFLQDVTAHNRLCNIKSLRWERTAVGSEMSVTLARYIKAASGTPK